MANANPSKQGGKGRRTRVRPRTGTNPVPGYERRHNAENERIHQAQIDETNRNSALQRGPIPNADNQQIVAGKQKSGMDIINEIYAATKKPDLAAGLPPIKKPAPGIMTPGSGIAGAGRISASARGGGRGIAAGKMPHVNTGLNIDTSDVAKRAQNAAAMEYNPQLDAIRQMIGQTQTEGQRGIQQTGDAYSALQKSIQGQVPGVNKAYDDTQAQQAALYAKLTGDIDARYNATQGRDAAEFERLGIQAATPSTGAALTSDRDFLSGIAGLQGAGIQGALELQQRGAVDLTRGNANRAGLAGANAQTDMRQELASKILELRSQKTSLKGNKARSRRELMDQYTQEARANAERDRAFGLDAAQFQESVFQDRRNFRQNQEESQASLGLKAAELQQSAAADAAKQQQVDFKSLDPQERAAAKADQLVPGSGARMFAYLQNLMNSDKNIRRGFYLKQTPDGKTIQVKITPEQFGYLAAKQAKITGLPKGSVQKIATAYWMER